MSRPEALQYREACLKFTVKKADRHLLLDVLREESVEVESFHSMLEASLISAQLEFQKAISIFCIFETCLRKSKNMRSCTAVATTVARLWEAVNSYYVRMRMSGDLDKVHVAAQAKPEAAGSDMVCHNCGRKGHYARDCPNPPKCSRQVRACCQGLLGREIH